MGPVSKAPTRDEWSKGYIANSKSMRDASRWLIGVVAGILLAATNLSGFGQLDPEEWRFWLAVIAAVFAVVSINAIIQAFLGVQIGGEMDWTKLNDEDFAFARSYDFLLNHDSFAAFLKYRDKVLADYVEVRSHIGTTPLLLHQQLRTDLEIQQQDLLAEHDRVLWEKHDVETLLGWRVSKRQFDIARKSLTRLGIVAAVSTLALVWAVNGPSKSSTTVVVVFSTSTPETTNISPTPVSQGTPVTNGIN